MDFKEFTAGKDDGGRRLDRIIRRFIKEENLSGIYKIIRKGLVRVNGKKCPPEQHIIEGDNIRIASFLMEGCGDNRNLPAAEQQKCSDEKYVFPYEIVFHNHNILIINKPYNKNVHGSSDSIEKDVEKFYDASFPAKTSISFRPGPLHRLDRRTTGLLAFSWSLAGAKWFSSSLAEHAVTKTYLGIVSGCLKDTVRWEDFISKNIEKEHTHTEMKKDCLQYSGNFHTVSAEKTISPGSKKAVTTASPLWSGTYKGTNITLVEYRIETGRTHQIRSQSALHGLPLLGDTAYGGTELEGNRQLFLHAVRLDIPENNPVNLPAVLKAPLPQSFKNFLSLADCGIQL